MTSRVKVGEVIVDSASFWIGDPAYVPCGSKTVQDFCGKKRICRVRGAFLGPIDGVIGYTGTGDGTFPVYAEYSNDGDLLRVILEFDEEE